MRRRLPRKDRLGAAISMFLAVLSAADDKLRRLPSVGEILKVYDTSEKIIEWAFTFCGHLLRDQKTGKAVPFAHAHFVLFMALLYFRRVLVVLPRGFGKSTICTVIYPLYCVCEKTRRYIMLGSYVAANARKFVYTLRTELETNDRIKAHYGILKSIDAKWTDEFFITADDIVVEAIYFGKGDLRGTRYINVRPELVILDDLQTKEQARNPARVDEVYDWIYDEVTKLYLDVQIIVVGTILYDGDVICRMIEDAELLDDEESALADLDQTVPDLTFRLVMVEASDEEVTWSAWPEMFPVPVLRAMRTENEASYDQEMRHLPRSRKVRDFRNFHYYDLAELKDAPVRAFPFIDLIPGESDLKERRGKDCDYYAHGAILKHLVSGQLYGFAFWRGRDLQKSEMVSRAVDFYEQLHAIDPNVRIAGEANNFQVWFLELFLEEAERRGLYPPVDAIVSKGNKIDRITANDTPVNTGRVKFLAGDPVQKILVSELIHLRNSRVHDDLADVFAGAMAEARKHRHAGQGKASTGEYKSQAMGW